MNLCSACRNVTTALIGSWLNCFVAMIRTNWTMEHAHVSPFVGRISSLVRKFNCTLTQTRRVKGQLCNVCLGAVSGSITGQSRSLMKWRRESGAQFTTTTGEAYWT